VTYDRGDPAEGAGEHVYQLRLWFLRAMSVMRSMPQASVCT